MNAGIHHLTCDQGSTFRKTITMKQSDGTTNVDLTGYTARMKIKEEYGGTLIKSLTSATGQGLTVGGSAGTPTNGEIDIEISATDTAAMTPNTIGVYDLEIASSGGVVDRVLQGKFIITPEVTD
tara:strand:- start:2716 stop:3087 length:372 start_codon:yes stop_codon:yes gene_type:complete